MSPTDEKGTFSTDISQDVINDALKSVERREKGTESGEAEAGAPAAGAGAAAPASELDELKAELELSLAKGRELMGKLKDEHEKHLRAAADLENYRRRAQKEKDEVQKFGNERLLKDLFPVFDNLDRALEHARSPADFDSLKKGVEMIRRLFEDAVGKHGVKAYSAKGEPFDPNRHEAMSAEETDAVPPNHVVSEVLRGFSLNERVVRPALVVVSRAPPGAVPGAGDGKSTAGTPADDVGGGI